MENRYRKRVVYKPSNISSSVYNNSGYNDKVPVGSAMRIVLTPGQTSRTSYPSLRVLNPAYSTIRVSIPDYSAETDNLKEHSLDAHNMYRSQHQTPPLIWSDELAKEAEAWAQKLARDRKLSHATPDQRKNCGENLAMMSGRFDVAGEEATKMWYQEVSKYNFKRHGFQSECGHFTQIVWKNSKELGMGRAKTADGQLTYIVARYRPAGNMIGKFVNNVFKQV